MPTPDPVVITGAVEGDLDDAVLRRLVAHIGATAGPVYGRHGKAHLRQRLNGYNQAARLSPWVVLVDLNHDADCAPPLLASWLPHPASNMCFRIAVRMVEAWLLADRDRLSLFLSIPRSQLPFKPEELDDPKHTIIELARLSRRRDIREDIVPRPGSGRTVGPAYTSRLIEFVFDRTAGWRPDIAANFSDSLDRCLRCLQRFLNSMT